MKQERFNKAETTTGNQNNVLLPLIVFVLLGVTLVPGGIADGGRQTGLAAQELRVASAMHKQTPRHGNPSISNRMKVGSLCYKDETIVFSAALKGNDKLVSICSSKKLDESQGYLQYRFGRPEKVELCFPESRKDRHRSPL